MKMLRRTVDKRKNDNHKRENKGNHKKKEKDCSIIRRKATNKSEVQTEIDYRRWLNK